MATTSQLQGKTPAEFFAKRKELLTNPEFVFNAAQLALFLSRKINEYRTHNDTLTANECDRIQLPLGMIKEFALEHDCFEPNILEAILELEQANDAAIAMPQYFVKDSNESDSSLDYYVVAITVQNAVFLTLCYPDDPFPEFMTELADE